jgi:hypothetical protein
MEFSRELRSDVLAAHAGPIDEDTLVFRIEFRAVRPDD